MVKRKTSKKSRGPNRSNQSMASTPMTLPALRHSFDRIDEWVSSRIHKSKPSALVSSFRSEWKKVFGRDVPVDSAERYLSLKKGTAHRTRVTRKKGSQKGGMAPLDYMVRPGVTGVYGSFPAYVSSGFNAVTWKDGLTANCGKECSTPSIPVDIGSNLVTKGGKRSVKQTKNRTAKKRTYKGGSVVSTIQTMLDRPFSASAPPSYGYTSSMAFKGVDVSAPIPQNTSVEIQAYDPGILKTSPAVVMANLPTQVLPLKL